MFYSDKQSNKEEVKAVMDENKSLKEKLDQKINQNKILSAELKEVWELMFAHVSLIERV